MQLLMLNGVTPFVVTGDLIKPVTDAISSSLSTLTPIGLGIMATFISLGLIKRVIFTFL